MIGSPAYSQKIETIEQGPIIAESDITSICDQLHNIKHSYATLKLCVIPFTHNNEILSLTLMIDPIQDLMSKEIFLNTYKSGEIDKLNFFFLLENRHNPGRQSKIITKDRAQYINAIQQCPKIVETLLEVRRALFLENVQSLDEKSAVEVIKVIAKDIRSTLKSSPGDESISTNDNTNRIIITKDTSPFSGNELYKTHPIRPRLLLSKLKKILYASEINKAIIKPLKRGASTISIDAKYLYMDNGSKLYSDILYNSIYHNYLVKEVSLLHQFGEQYGGSMKSKYIGLGVGNGEKDFELLRYAPKFIQKIFIDSSLPSLQEAEVLCRQSKERTDNLQTHCSNVKFSLDWINLFAIIQSNLVKDPDQNTYQPKGIDVIQSTFHNPHTERYNLASLHEGHTFFSLLGGMFGNFSHEYKVKFLQEIDAITMPGDTILMSVFNRPQTQEEIANIIEHYDTSQTQKFVSNFFGKLGVDEKFIYTKVSYKNNTIHIDADIIPPDNGSVTLSCYGSKVMINKPIHVNISQSQRMSEDDMKYYLEKSKTNLQIEKIITDNDSPFTLYLLKKI